MSDEKNEEPEVYGIVKGPEGFALTRRAWLGALGAGAAAVVACGPEKAKEPTPLAGSVQVSTVQPPPPAPPQAVDTAPTQPAEVPKPKPKPKPKKAKPKPPPEPEDLEPERDNVDKGDEQHKKKRRVRKMAKKTFTVPCGSPIPPDAVCICDCIASSANLRSNTEMVCVCDTIEVSAGKRMPVGTICTCDTVCTCDTIGGSTGGGSYYGGGHYWYPN